MKIEMPQEPEVERLWTRDSSTSAVREWVLIVDNEGGRGWEMVGDPQRLTVDFNVLLRVYRAVYTEHPDLDVLKDCPTPWKVINGGTIVDASNPPKVVMEANIRCSKGRNRFIATAVNELIARAVNERAEGLGAGEDEKR